MQRAPRPPDLTPVSNAQLELGRQASEIAREQLGLSREQFAWFREQGQVELDFAREQANRMFGLQERALASEAPMREMSLRVGEAQRALMEQSRDFASRDRERWERTFIPLQDRFIREAEAYDTPERREQEAARAMLDVQQQTDAQRRTADARLTSMGLDPSQFRSATISTMLGVNAAAQGALQGNNARRAVEDRGRALRADAINLGMGLPAQATQAIGVSSAAGNSAVGAAQAGQQGALNAIGTAGNLMGAGVNMRAGALNNMANWTGTPMQWAQTGMSGFGTAGNMFNNAGATLNQGYANQMARYNANQNALNGLISNAAGIAGAIAAFSKGGEVKSARSYRSGGTRLGAGPIQDVPFAPVERMRIDPIKPRVSAIQPMSPIQPMAKTDVQRPDGGWRTRVQDMIAKADEVSAGFPGADPYNQLDTTPEQFLQYRYMANGGRVQGALPIRESRDMIPAMLAEGEYVIPANAARAIGIEKLDKMVAKYEGEVA